MKDDFVTDEDITNAFLHADPLRFKMWHERTVLEKLFFWKTYKTPWIRPEMQELAIKNPNFLKDLIEEDLESLK